jgi:hypothetical protein
MGVETEDLDLKWCGVEQCSPPFWSTLEGSYGEGQPLIRSQDIPSQQLGNPKNIATKPHHLHYRYNLSTSNKEGETNIQYRPEIPVCNYL